MFASDLALQPPLPSTPRDRNGSRGTEQGGTKIVRRRTTAGEVEEKLRPTVSTMVQIAEPRVGGRMLAYDAVGREIGESGQWVRKLLACRAVQVTAATYLNITAAYLEMCAKAEEVAAANKADALALAAELLGDQAQP